MPKINDVIVNIGDTVHDIANGSGKVVAIAEQTIEVKFLSGRRQSFDANGYANGVRRLFWHDPVFIDPPRDKKAWSKLKDAMTEVFRIIAAY